MLLDIIERISFYAILHRIDVDLAATKKSAGCPYCGGRLDQASYIRKPRGGPDDIPEQCSIRLSLCCSRDGCRRRTLPPSSLFFGRRVYWGGVLLVLVTLRQQRIEGRSAGQLCRRFGVARSTLARWMAYFREEFPISPLWQRLRGRVKVTVGNARLPGDLVEFFVASQGQAYSGLVACLKLLASGWTCDCEHVP